MSVRTQITMEPTLKRRARARAAELRISFAEYVRRIVMRDLGEGESRADVSLVFDLAEGGPETDIARNKDCMVRDAVSAKLDREAGPDDRREGVETGY